MWPSAVDDPTTAGQIVEDVPVQNSYVTIISNSPSLRLKKQVGVRKYRYFQY